MNLSLHPQLLDRLAASYALGTLRGGARRRFETLAREHARVRAAALVWQTRWAGLAELQDSKVPAPAVWTRIHNLVQADLAAAAQRAVRGAPVAVPRRNWWASLLLWRGAAALGAMATLAAVVVGLQVNGGVRAAAGMQIAALQQQLQATPQIQYVAVLSDPQSNASMLVTVDPRHGQLQLQRVGSFREASDRSLQLWALPPQGAPRSLGVLGSEPLLQLPTAEDAVRAVPTLAVSLEPKGGVPSAGGPTGPVLFTGALIKRML